MLELIVGPDLPTADGRPLGIADLRLRPGPARIAVRSTRSREPGPGQGEFIPPEQGR